MSYRKSHVRGKIHKIRPKTPLYKKLWFWILVLVVILASSACYFILFYSGWQISNIIISGNQKVQKDNIESLVLADISHKFLGILNSRSIFLADAGKISKEIAGKFPEIAVADVSRQFMQGLEVKITEKVPAGIFCQQDESCFYFDKTGSLFENANGENSGFVIVESPASNAEIGQTVLEQNVVDLVVETQKDLQDKFQIGLKTAVVASQIRLNTTTTEGWQIYFDLSENSNANDQLVKLNSLLTGEITQNQRKSLYYIDLRPKDRAIVCDNFTCGRK